MSVYQGVRNVIFSENFVYLLNEWSPITVFDIVAKVDSEKFSSWKFQK